MDRKEFFNRTLPATLLTLTSTKQKEIINGNVCVELYAIINSSFLFLLNPYDSVWIVGHSVVFSFSPNTIDKSVLPVPSLARMRF